MEDFYNQGSPIKCYGTIKDDDSEQLCPYPVKHIIGLTEDGSPTPEENVKGKIYACELHFQNVLNKGYIENPYAGVAVVPSDPTYLNK